MGENLAGLLTEQVNEATKHLDELDTLDAIALINREDQKVAQAVQEALPQIAQLIDAIYERMKRGGRLFYIGAGTSGRLGVLDASECPPTYGVSSELVQGIIAGGDTALRNSVENAEDDCARGEQDLVERGFGPGDALVGLAASGRTPYVIGALDYARSIGSVTGSVCCVPGAEISHHCDYPIECITGPESVTGSTRMKAGTAQKMVLNMISTELMVKRGKVYGNLMVDVRPTNEKLVARAIRIVAEAAGCERDAAAAALEASGNDVKVAICMVLSDKDADTSRSLLDARGGNVSRAVRDLRDDH